MLQKSLILTCLLALQGPTLAQQPKPAPSIPAPLLTSLRSAAGKSLKDPYSAQFERVQRATRPNVRGEPTDVVCGYVNAKNAFGAYVGAQPFLFFVKDSDFIFQRPGDTADSITVPAMLKTFCTGLL